MAGPTILSLFSGVGGLELAVRLAIPGSRVVGYVERDSYACSALMARMEESSMEVAPVFVGDIQDVDGRELRGEVDIVCGGIPCQPYSVAGTQLGDEDERALWPEFARIVGECGASMVFLENVPAFVTGAGFRPLGEELSRLGYEIADPIFLSAGDIGAPHLRNRVFIVAYSNGPGSEGQRRLSQLVEGVRTPQWDDTEGCGEVLADSPRGGRGVLRKSPGPDGQPDGRHENVADPEDDHGRSGVCGEEAGVGEGGERGRRPPVSGTDVADTSGPGRERGQPIAVLGSRGGGKRRTASELCEAQGWTLGERGIPDTERDEVRDESERGGGPSRASVRWDSFARHLGIFPPGPDDEEEWGRILRDNPGVAPAIEPGFRSLVDGVPVVVDEGRADQLRCAGNSVVVAQAYVAFRTIIQRLKKEE